MRQGQYVGKDYVLTEQAKRTMTPFRKAGYPILSAPFEERVEVRLGLREIFPLIS
jgi:hypothetical protein